MHSSSDTVSKAQTDTCLSPGPLENAFSILLSGDFQSRWEVAKQMPALGEAVITPLLALLADEDLEWEVRWFVARILGHFERPEVVEALLALLLNTEDEDLRQGAADALTRIGPGALQALEQLLAQPSRRELAVWALAQIRHPATVPLLLNLVQNDSAVVRALAVEALAGYRSDRVLAALQTALADVDGTVRLRAVEAIAGYRYQLEDARLTQLLQPRLQDGDLAVAKAAIAALGRLASAEAAAALADLLQTPQTAPSLRLAAIQALGWMASLPALQALQPYWGQASLAERLAIVAALSRQNPAEPKALAAAMLLGWLQSWDSPPDQGHPAAEEGAAGAEEWAQVRQQGALALAHLGATAAIPLLQTWQNDPDEGVRLHAIAALRRLAANE